MASSKDHSLTSDDLRGDVQQATAALAKSEEAHPSKHELRLNAIGDVYENVAGVSSNPYVTSTSDLANATASLLQPDLDKFRASCDILMKSLDVVAQIHPFASVAVLAFKTAITFELTRRQNDKRILALHITMSDMMAVVGLLSKLAADDCGMDGVSINSRLCDRMQAIAKDIQTCASTCDSFQKKKLIVKVFKSLAWEGKLEDFATAFDGHKECLHKDLAMHAGLGIERANQTLSAVAASISATDSKIGMVLLFQELRSAEERELRKFIESKGGPEEFLHDDKLMDELIARTEKGTVSPTSSKELKYDLKKDISDIIKDNLQISENLFHALQTNISIKMETTVRREGDRIIGALLTSPGDRIVDPTVWQTWTDMGWKNSTKARHLVMALREFYMEKFTETTKAESEGLADIAAASNERCSRDLSELDASRKKRVAGVRIEDIWTLDHITLLRLQPLMEAFDSDVSTWVTVTEVNAFTQSRPRDWSLLHWMAYWTVGFPLSITYYFRRIQAVAVRISDISEQVLPTNRALVDRFVGSVALQRIELILTAAYQVKEQVRWDDDLFNKFSGYVTAQERRMKESLQTVKYNIDTPRAMVLLLGSEAVEKNLLPFLYLLLHKCYEIIVAACQVPLHRNELFTLTNSITMLHRVFAARLGALRGVCKILNTDLSGYLRRFSFGLFYYANYPQDCINTPYYKEVYFGKDDQTFRKVEIDDVETDVTKVLAMQPQQIDVDSSAYSNRPMLKPLVEPEPTQSSSWNACWRGFLQGDGDSYQLSIGHLDFALPDLDGLFSGSGADSFGSFTLLGKREGSHLVFTKTYPKPSDCRDLTFEGSINGENDNVTGRYCLGRQITEDTAFPVISSDVSVGTFVLFFRPLYYYTHRPHQSEFDYNKPRALWKFVLDAVLHAVRTRAKNVPWEFFRDRRNQRRRYAELYMQLDELLGLERDNAVLPYITQEECWEFANFEACLTTADLLFYRSIAKCAMRRRVFHLECFCDNCGIHGFTITRLVCLECTIMTDKYDVDTIDLDTPCMWAEFTREKGSKQHKNIHRLLQIRRPAPHQKMYELVSQAQKMLVDLDQAVIHVDKNDQCSAHPRCVRCNEIPSQPYFYCVECQGKSESYVCVDCNEKMGKDYLSLALDWDRPFSAETGHNWFHHMILYQAVPKPPCTPSVEERLSTLELNFKDLESSLQERQDEISGRLERLEGMVSQILDTVVLLRRASDSRVD